MFKSSTEYLSRTFIFLHRPCGGRIGIDTSQIIGYFDTIVEKPEEGCTLIINGKDDIVVKESFDTILDALKMNGSQKSN